MSNFCLRKWYLDAADNQGNLYIGYRASLQWHSVHLHFCQHLYRTPASNIRTLSSLSRSPEPVYQANKQLIWQDDTVEGVWDSLADAVGGTLLRSNIGEIRWYCTQPKAQASIHLLQSSFTGFGYTEYLEITIPVWNLPFHTLYWGRTHSENHYVVWIEWDGETRQNLAWHNGERSHELTISDTGICASSFDLRFGEDVTTLRQGQLESTVFEAFSNIAKQFPAKVLGINEHKCFTIGQLNTSNSCEKATTIYESVHW